MGDEEHMDMAAMVADVVPELWVLVGGVVVLLFALFAPRRLQPLAAPLALLALVGSGVTLVGRLTGPGQLTFTDTYAVDPVGGWGAMIILAATAGVVALSTVWFRNDPRHGEYYTLLLFSALGAMLLAGASDLMQFTLAMLLSSITGYVLAAYHRASRVASEAGIKYYLIGALTGAAMLIGIAYLFGLAGTTTLGGLAADLPDHGPALVAGAALVLVAVAFKLGAVPAHAWVPDVAQGAPAPVAAFVTSVPKVGGFIFLARFVAALPDTVGWRPLLALVALLTMTLGNLAALWQDDVRRLLGWSAVSQTGYGLLALVALGRSDLALPSLLVFLVAYVAGNLAAFGAVVQLRGRTKLADYHGLARHRPWMAAAIAVAFLSFIGVPPLVGFVAKLLLFAAAIEAAYLWLAVAGVVNTIISIFYYVRVLAPTYFEQPPKPVAVLGTAAGTATLLFAGATIGVGLAAEPLIDAFQGLTLVP